MYRHYVVLTATKQRDCSGCFVAVKTHIERNGTSEFLCIIVKVVDFRGICQLELSS